MDALLLSQEANTTFQYGIGYSYGNIVTADVNFAGYDLPRQAFVDAVDAVNPVLNLGAAGVLGLGFTALSGVDVQVNSTGGSYGRSLLYNVFAQDPSVPNFISFLLSRNRDPDAPVEGSFTISEVFHAPHCATHLSSQVSTILNIPAYRARLEFQRFRRTHPRGGQSCLMRSLLAGRSSLWDRQ